VMQHLQVEEGAVHEQVTAAAALHGAHEGAGAGDVCASTKANTSGGLAVAFGAFGALATCTHTRSPAAATSLIHSVLYGEIFTFTASVQPTESRRSRRRGQKAIERGERAPDAARAAGCKAHAPAHARLPRPGRLGRWAWCARFAAAGRGGGSSRRGGRSVTS
jgi:hypothetical protein